jgi:predicted DNA-binding protein
MRTTIELSDRTYERLRRAATERGPRDFSLIVEEALERFLETGDEADLASELVAAEGASSARDRDEWERARRDAWETWPAVPSRDL